MRSFSASLVFAAFGAGLALAPSAGRAGDFGALAFSAEGAWGYSYNFDHARDAVNRARAECRKHASGCVVVQVFANACVTVVRNDGDGDAHITWADGPDSSRRLQQATADCARRGGSDCRVLKIFCTGNARDN